MASIVEKKFNWFEQHLRENLKDRTLASALYEGIPEGETDMFMVFYLKILLDKLDKDKANSLLEVPDTDRAEPRFGYRTAVPVPKGGISAIKTGNVPKFNLDEFIEETLTKAIKDYLNSISINSDLSRELASIPSLETVSREELKALDIPLKKRSSGLFDLFHLQDYLSENNHRFITKQTITNMRSLHNFCIYGAAFGNPIKAIFPDVQDDPSKVYLNPTSEWIKVRTGIIPVGVVPDLPKEPANLIKLLRTGQAAQFTVNGFRLEPLETFASKVDSFYVNYHEMVSNADTAKVTVILESLDDILTEGSELEDYFKNTFQKIHAYDFLGTNFFSKREIELSALFFKSYLSYLADYLKGSETVKPVYDTVYTEKYNGTTMYGNYRSFVESLNYDDHGDVIIQTIYDPDDSSRILSDERPVILERFNAFMVVLNAAAPYLMAVQDSYWDYCKQSFSLVYQYDEIQQLSDVTPAKVKTFVNLCNDFFGVVVSLEESIITGIKNTIESFKRNADALPFEVDAEFLATKKDEREVFGNTEYGIIPYKGTIICYKYES